jgi:hypothetical protein
MVIIEFMVQFNLPVPIFSPPIRNEWATKRIHRPLRTEVVLRTSGGEFNPKRLNS